MTSKDVPGGYSNKELKRDKVNALVFQLVTRIDKTGFPSSSLEIKVGFTAIREADFGP